MTIDVQTELELVSIPDQSVQVFVRPTLKNVSVRNSIRNFDPKDRWDNFLFIYSKDKTHQNIYKENWTAAEVVTQIGNSLS